MSEPENFLERWSRKKREAADETMPPGKPPEQADKKPDAPPEVAEVGKPFDLADLPSLESITAETDVRGFLQAGVPEDLKREALRRAWAADPGIRDFVELLENGWDFNDPDAVMGFGPIAPDEVARLMSQFVLAEPEENKKQAAGAANEGDKQGSPASAAGDRSAVVDNRNDVDPGHTGRVDENAAPQNKSESRSPISPGRDETA